MQLQSSVPPGFSFQHVPTAKLRKMKQFSDATEHQKFSSPKVLLLNGFVVTGGWYNFGWLKRSECVPTCTDHLLISLGLTRQQLQQPENYSQFATNTDDSTHAPCLETKSVEWKFPKAKPFQSHTCKNNERSNNSKINPIGLNRATPWKLPNQKYLKF